MSNITVSDVIKAMKTVMLGPSIPSKVDAANEMLADGRIDGIVHAQLQQRFADERYAGDHRSLAKFLGDPDGQRMTNFAAQTSYVSLQKATALGNAADVRKMRETLEPVAMENKPRAHRAMNDPDRDSDDDGGDASIDQKVERLMRDKNISRDAAISILHRAEKVAKGFTV